jgi:DNA polymerase-3 subunit alpha
MWANLHCHSDNSLLDGLSKPRQILERCVNVGIPATAITDHGTISGSIEFMKAKKELVQKFEREKKKAKNPEIFDKKIEAVKKIKIILGCEFYIAEENKKNSHLVVLAKNKLGWLSLIKATSEASRKENFYRKPRLKLEQFAPYTNGNLVTFSGHMGSALANILFLNIDAAYKARTVDEAKILVDSDYEQKAVELFNKYIDIFGAENVFVEIQRIDQENLPAAFVVANLLSSLADKYGWRKVATCDAHYPDQIDARDQRVVLCTGMGVTLPDVTKRIDNDDDEVGLAGFFKSSNYYIPSPDHMKTLHTEDELANSMMIADMCEEYSVITKPKAPKFNCPDGMSENDYLRHLCREGWKLKIANNIDKEQYQEYGDRVKSELSVLQKADLSGYFLTLWDIAEFVKRSGKYCGIGRGSAAGCMVSYLIGLTALDPIPYGLIFERFYNDGRNTADHISMPDIDFDVQASFRDQVINYTKEKNGRDRVGQICTFGRMMGRGVMKDVLRVHGACSFEEMNKITEFIPDEAEISDQLQEMREEDGESSIIKWALLNNNKELEPWARIDEDGEVVGPYAIYFKQAMRLEGTKRSQGKHAAGIVISPTPLEETFPIIYDRKTGEPIIAVSMNDVEALGGIKYDVLGLSILDKIQGFDQFLAEGDEC